MEGGFERIFFNFFKREARVGFKEQDKSVRLCIKNVYRKKIPGIIKKLVRCDKKSCNSDC